MYVICLGFVVRLGRLEAGGHERVLLAQTNLDVTLGRNSNWRIAVKMHRYFLVDRKAVGFVACSRRMPDK